MTALSSKQAERVNKTGKRIGKKFVEKDVSTSQLRKVYGEIKQAENEFKFKGNPEQAKQTLQLLKPHLAYSASRKKEMKAVNEEVTKYMELATGNSKDNEQMELFFRLMEATVAYHAYYENERDDN